MAGWGLGTLFVLVIGSVVAFFVGYARVDIPDPNEEFTANATIVTYADGASQIGSFYEQNRSSVPIAEIPKSVQDAVIAAEDRTFWTNPGVSLPGMARAAINIARGKQLQGGSTITQQYVKVMYLSQERTMSRKFDELFIATKLSRTQEKKSLLEGYLNTIYFGEGAYGVRAAGQVYFGVDHPKDLTVPQAAYLATVLNNPTRFDSDDPAASRRILERYRYVLSGMHQIGTITADQYSIYRKVLPPLKKRAMGGRYAGPKGFLLDMARRELAKYGFDADEVSGGGLHVVTTFDLGLQTKAIEAIRKTSPANTADLHVALASVRPETGELAALVGGSDYLKSQLNWATTKAAPGPMIRPFALAALLQRDPAAVLAYRKGGQAEHKVSRAYFDLIDAKQGERIAAAAEAAGFPSIPAGDRQTPGLGPDTLASPVDVASAFSTFTANGRHSPVHVIREVRDSHDKVLWSAARERSLHSTQAISQDVSAITNNVLQQAMSEVDAPILGNRGFPFAGELGTAVGLDLTKRRAAAKCKCKSYGKGQDILASWWLATSTDLSTAVLYRAGKEGESNLDPYSAEKGFPATGWPARTWAAYSNSSAGEVSAQLSPLAGG